NITLPRVRDFGGVSPNSFDGRGNFAMGIREQLVFPEIDYDTIDRTRGMDVIITTTARNDEEARALLRQLGVPCRERYLGVRPSAFGSEGAFPEGRTPKVEGPTLRGS